MEILLNVPELTPSPPTLPILLTCRLWNSLVIKTIHFWTHIDYPEIIKRVSTLKLFLERSKKALLQVTMATSITNYAHVAACALRDNFWRIETLRFKGHPAGFFPLTIPMPHLHTLEVDFSGWRRDEIASSSEILPPGLHLEVLVTRGPGSARVFQDVEPSGLRDVTLLGGWPFATGIPFLELCTRLQILSIDLRESPSDGGMASLEFPLLHTLCVHVSATRFRTHFASLPELVHLTIICDYETLGGLENGHRESTVHSVTMPRLRTLTMNHFSLENVVLTLRGTPCITALHLHGCRGFDAIFKFLLEKPPPEESKEPGADSGAPALPLLQCLRVFPVESSSAQVAFGLEGDGGIVSRRIRDLLEARPALSVTIGAMRHDRGYHVWPGSWDLLSLAAVFDGLELHSRPTIYDPNDCRSSHMFEIVRTGCPSLPAMFP